MIQRRTAPCGADGAQTAAALLRRTARSVNATLGRLTYIHVCSVSDLIDFSYVVNALFSLLELSCVQCSVGPVFTTAGGHFEHSV